MKLSSGLGKTAIICFILLNFIFITSGFTQSSPNEATITLSYYFDLLVSGNLETAKGLWTDPIIERSSRFGISYNDIPVKLDCSSPVVRNLPVMRDFLFKPARQVKVLDGGNYFSMEYSALVQGKQITHFYYAYFDGEYYWLTHPQEYYTKDWPVMETKYFRLHYHPDREAYLNPVILSEADKFIETTAKTLSLSNSDLAMIEEKKIEYYYCPDDKTVEDISGFKVKGFFDLPTNDVISSFFPHFHEISHLLINFRLRNLPLYTLPIMREGFAVYLGGRWGKSVDALNYLGSFLYDQKFIELDSITTMERFEKHATADMAYPVVGMFSAYVIDQIGIEKYLDLYRKLSGSYDSLFFMNHNDVEKIFTEALSKADWMLIREEFGNYVNKIGNINTPFKPGIDKNGKLIFENNQIKVTEKDDWLSFRITGLSDSIPDGTFLFGWDNALIDAKSVLFEEQQGSNLTMDGFRFGVVFDMNEAGLYDYATNQLLGKYIYGLTPSDEYQTADNNTVSFKFNKKLSGNAILSPEENKLYIK